MNSIKSVLDRVQAYLYLKKQSLELFESVDSLLSEMVSCKAAIRSCTDVFDRAIESKATSKLFYVGIDKQRHSFPSEQEGYVMLHSNPFRLMVAYSVNKKEKISPLERLFIRGSEKVVSTSSKKLSEIDSVIVHNVDSNIKVEVKSGEVYFNNKLLSSYFP